MSDYAPLSRVKVLDLTATLPGPYCTMLLAGLGAQVIKVESPGRGDFMRAMAPAAFPYLNGQKELLSLDLKHPRGREIFMDLAADCDALVEGFRPGVAARLGVDFDAVALVNPSIIYCTLSGYGHQGPYANYPGHDINYMGVAGVLSISGEPDSNQPEYPHGPQTADMVGSLFAANAILAALLGRRDGDGPRLLDVSLTEGAAMLMMPRYLDFLAKGRPAKQEFMARGPYGVFQCRDGKFLTLGIVEDHFWGNFCREAGLPELAEDPALQGWNARNQQAARLRPILERVLKTRDREAWLAALIAADVPVAPVHDLNDWTQDPQLRARGFFQAAADPQHPAAGLPRFPLPGLARQDRGPSGEVPVGRDTEKCLQALGLEQGEIDSLREQKVI